MTSIWSRVGLALALAGLTQVGAAAIKSAEKAQAAKTKAPKRYRISARCGGGNLGVSRRVRVLAPL